MRGYLDCLNLRGIGLIGSRTPRRAEDLARLARADHSTGIRQAFNLSIAILHANCVRHPNAVYWRAMCDSYFTALPHRVSGMRHRREGMAAATEVPHTWDVQPPSECVRRVVPAR